MHGIEGGIVKRAYMIFIHIVLVLLIVIIFLGRRRTTPQEPAKAVRNEVTRKRIVPVIVSHPMIGDVIYRVRLTGEVKGEEGATVFADVPGRFLKFLVGEGEYVKKGEPIAQIEREIPGLEFEPVRVESPISGVVSLLPLEAGQIVTPQTPLARVAKISRVKVLFQTPEIYAGGVRPGKAVKVEVASLKKSFDGKITWVSTFLDPITRTASAYALVDNSKRHLRPGMFARVELAVDERKGVLTLPSSTILGLEDKYVFVVEKGRARRRHIEVGLDDGVHAEILQGLTDEDLVITIGQEVVEEGDTLNISMGGNK